MYPGCAAYEPALSALAGPYQLTESQQVQWSTFAMTMLGPYPSSSQLRSVRTVLVKFFNCKLEPALLIIRKAKEEAISFSSLTVYNTVP